MLVGVFCNPQTQINHLNGEFDNTSWIIGIGASNHVTGNISFLTDIRDVNAFPIGLPDGQSVVATKQGTVKLMNKISFNNVFYVPKLHCNLISVSQLDNDMSCFVHFSSNMCVIQD